MTFRAVMLRRLLATGIGLVLAMAAIAPATVAAGSLDPDLLVTLELDDGFIEYELDAGTLHFLDEGNQPLALEVIDGCAVNDHFWIFGAGLSGIPIQLNVRDLGTGEEARPYLPSLEPGKPIKTVFDPAALPTCADVAEAGGLPRLDATVTFTSARDDGQDGSAAVSLLSDGSDHAYRRLVQGDHDYRLFGRGSPIAAIDQSPGFDRLYLLTEGRTPRSVEGVVFSGAQGMLPPAGKLEKALSRITDARARRAYEAAKGGQVPAGIIEDLGLRKVQRVHHADFDFESLGSAAYLTMAGWLREGATPVKPPAPVAERFSVELITAAGDRTPVPLVGPLAGSEEAGTRWDYRTDGAIVQIVDACDHYGSFWIWAGARTDEPLELVVTEATSGEVVPFLLWTEQRSVSRLADTASLAFCP